MKLILVRERAASNDAETQGILVIGNVSLYTMEQPWRDNAIGHSCIPEGDYDVIPHISPSKGACWIIDGPAQNVYANDPPAGGRSLVLIHSANFAWQLEGCIAPGLLRGQLSGQDAVLSSRDAMVRLTSLLGRSDTHQMSVRWDRS